MQTALLSTMSLMAGFIGSLMSGGSIVIFSVLTFLDLPVQNVVGTLKITIAALTLVSAATYYQGGAVEIGSVPYLVSFSIIGALSGSYLFSFLPAGPAGAVSLGLLLIGLYFSVRPHSSTVAVEGRRASRVLISAVGFAVGAYIGILGIASTLIVIAALRAFSEWICSGPTARRKPSSSSTTSPRPLCTGPEGR